MAYEDSDEPASTLTAQPRRFFETVGRLEGSLPYPALQMTAAVATYLAFRRDEVGEADADVLRLAVRAEYPEGVPPEIAEWLAAAGVGT